MGGFGIQDEGVEAGLDPFATNGVLSLTVVLAASRACLMYRFP